LKCYLNINFLQVLAVSGKIAQGLVVDVMAALSYEIFQLSTSVAESPDAVPGNQIAPGNVEVDEIGTAL